MVDQPHFACLCLTYRRPNLLRSALESFLRQDYPRALRELIILDDAGQYPDGLCGPGWRIISTPDRYPTLGDKRNACAALASPDVDTFAVWDDDDIYLPWHLSDCAEAIQRYPTRVSAPSWCWCEVSRAKPLAPEDCLNGYHAAWSYTREAFDAIGGYPSIDNGEDKGFGLRLYERSFAIADSCFLRAPSYVSNMHRESYHVSAHGRQSYADLADYGRGGRNAERVEAIHPRWSRDYVADAKAALDRLPRK